MEPQNVGNWTNKLDDEGRLLGVYIKAVDTDTQRARCIVCDKCIQPYLLKIVDHIKTANHQENLRSKHRLIDEMEIDGMFSAKCLVET